MILGRANIMTYKKLVLPPKRQRILDGVIKNIGNEEQEIVYSHSTMCQTCMPFVDLGEQREWKSINGASLVMIEAGQVFNPEIGDMQKVGLPYGAKPRLILFYLNRQAVLHKSPLIPVEDSLKQFIQSIGLPADGNAYKTVKDQLGRVAASQFTIGRIEKNGSGSTAYERIVKEMNVFFSKDDKQRILWPNNITLSTDYFNDLVEHAVPLDSYAIGLLKDSALELDLYAMLSERLHRIPFDKPQFVPWAGLYKQYGRGYSRIGDFRRKFLKALNNVTGVYSHARLEETKSNTGRPQGITLFNSKPPVSKIMMIKK